MTKSQRHGGRSEEGAGPSKNAIEARGAKQVNLRLTVAWFFEWAFCLFYHRFSYFIFWNDVIVQPCQSLHPLYNVVTTVGTCGNDFKCTINLGVWTSLRLGFGTEYWGLEFWERGSRITKIHSIVFAKEVLEFESMFWAMEVMLGRQFLSA